MTRLLVIGSSHVAAYRQAVEAFGAERPDISLGFFGLRGPLFLGGRIGADGIFSAPFRDDKDRAFVTETNGAETVDAGRFDHVLLVGYRFAFNQILTLLADNDILQGARTGKDHVITRAFFDELLDRMVSASVADAAAAVADFGRPVTFAMAPYPARSILERGVDYDLARILGAFWARGEAAALFDDWLDQVDAAVAASGHALLAQPNALCDGPYATKPAYAAEAAALDGALGHKDHRHMNADFGLAMLGAYADQHLGQRPATAKTKERIA